MKVEFADLYEYDLLDLLAGILITEAINEDPDEVALLRRVRRGIKDGTAKLTPWREAMPDPCCCGDPGCTEFEDRMAAWKIPLDELVELKYTVVLGPNPLDDKDESI